MQIIGTLNETLLIGQRTNVQTQKIPNSTFFSPGDVKRAAISFGKPSHPLANDFFIVYRNLFPWHAIPDVVIGRVLYDNFIVWTAMKKRMSVIDVTKTVTALHQTDFEGNGAGSRRQYGDVNKAIIGNFDFQRARTDKTIYYTALDNVVKANSIFNDKPTVNIHRRYAET